MASVSAKMQFMAPMAEEPFYRSQPDQGFDSCNFSYAPQDVQVHDARPNKGTFELDKHGFAYADDPEGAEYVEQLRNNEDGAKERYYAHLERLLKKQTGASRVVIFDHTMRRREPELAGKNPDGREQPAAYVHIDQGPVGAARRIHQHIGYEADKLLKGRVQIINVWRPLNGPVKDWPLATMDFTSLKPSNIHPTNLYRNRFELRGQSCNVSHHPDQRWHYLDSQRNDEVTFIKIWDNKSAVTGKTCAHCAFEHPDTPPDAPLRESMEVRCIVAHEDEELASTLWWT
ncbi:methyltransferase [Diplodia corticola]|uniref:Methyltransferase n=1 Tax=Diplodia corticola TaxID=236234 RepID=A0A1J9RTZ0_9PEZI|nr:methyltransferase [Diplodia corticola]OJD30973.1 methyltransferase [Diplodia corticola]